MSKQHILFLWNKLIEIGLYYTKKTITVPTKGGTTITIEKWTRSAIEDDYMDRYGRPDDKQVKANKMEEKMFILREIYPMLKEELIQRNRKELLISKIDEPSYLSDYFKLYTWCYSVMRVIELVVPFDRYFQATVMLDGKIPVGDKVIPASQVEGEN